jgi:hypothetical protein
MLALIFGTNRDEVTERWIKLYNLHSSSNYYGDQIKEDELVEALQYTWGRA